MHLRCCVRRFSFWMFRRPPTQVQPAVGSFRSKLVGVAIGKSPVLSYSTVMPSGVETSTVGASRKNQLRLLLSCRSSCRLSENSKVRAGVEVPEVHVFLVVAGFEEERGIVERAAHARRCSRFPDPPGSCCSSCAPPSSCRDARIRASPSNTSCPCRSAWSPSGDTRMTASSRRVHGCRRNPRDAPGAGRWRRRAASMVTPGFSDSR